MVRVRPPDSHTWECVSPDRVRFRVRVKTERVVVCFTRGTSFALSSHLPGLSSSLGFSEPGPKG